MRFTGVDNKLILENLYYLDRCKANIRLRCPLIPGMNLTHEHMLGLAHLANGLSSVLGIDIEPYNPLGISKCKQLGLQPDYINEKFLDKGVLKPYIELLKANTQVEVEVL